MWSWTKSAGPDSIASPLLMDVIDTVERTEVIRLVSFASPGQSIFRHFHAPLRRHMLERAPSGTGEPRDFRTHAKQPATRSYASLPAPRSFPGLGAIPAGHRWPHAGVRYGAVFHGSARGGQHLGNHHSGVGGIIAGHLRRPDHRALPGAAGRRDPCSRS